jgi:hypothetical protein
VAAVGDVEPQAAIIVTAASAAATERRWEAVLNIAEWYPARGHTSATRD